MLEVKTLSAKIMPEQGREEVVSKVTMRDAVISFPMFGEGFRISPPASISIGGFEIYFYGIIIALGLLLAVCYASKASVRFGMTMEQVYDYLIWAVVSAVICARLYYCLTYTDSAGVHTYLHDPLSILRIRDGGLAIYGGVIGAVLALCAIAAQRKEKVWKALDIMSLGLLIGQCVGRWGNFFNREAYGYETNIFCRMGLTLYGSTIYVHPTFLYESLWNLAGFLVLHVHSKARRLYQGQYFLLYLIWYGFGRMFIEGLRSDSLWLIPGVIRISQLLAAATFALALVVYLANRGRLEMGYRPFMGALDADDLPRRQPAAQGMAGLGMPSETDAGAAGASEADGTWPGARAPEAGTEQTKKATQPLFRAFTADSLFSWVSSVSKKAANPQKKASPEDMDAQGHPPKETPFGKSGQGKKTEKPRLFHAAKLPLDIGLSEKPVKKETAAKQAKPEHPFQEEPARWPSHRQ